jgi:hypothetical protein
MATAVHPLPLGTRVRHYGQQWARARAGTATIIAAEGPWHDGSYEYEVLTGEDFSRAPSDTNPQTRRTWWASYATISAEEQHDA